MILGEVPLSNKYSSIWKELKNNSHCSITANRAYHRQIIKALINIKYRDLGFKLKLDSEYKKAILTHVIQGSRIRFFMTYFDVYNIDSLEGITKESIS